MVKWNLICALLVSTSVWAVHDKAALLSLFHSSLICWFKLHWTFRFCFFCGVVSAFSIKPSPVWFCSLPFPICFSVLSGLHLLTSSLSEELLSLCVCCCCQSYDLHPSIIPLIRLRRLSDSQMKNEDFRAHIIFLIDWRNIWIIKCLWSSPKRFHLLTCDNCFLSCQFFVKILRESNFLFFFFLFLVNIFWHFINKCIIKVAAGLWWELCSLLSVL